MMEDLVLVQDYELVKMRRYGGMDGYNPDVPACEYVYLSDTYHWHEVDNILAREIIIPSYEGTRGPGTARPRSGGDRPKAYKLPFVITAKQYA